MQQKIKLDRVVFELTQACNQQCKFCYNHWKGTDDTKFVLHKSDYAKTKKVLQKLLSQAQVQSISFSGGEPMLFRRIHDLIMLTRFHKTNVSVLTNGTLLGDLDLYAFNNLGVERIQIPLLSADAKVHDMLTQDAGSHQKSLYSIQKILHTNPEKLSVVLVLTKRNLFDLDQTLWLYDKLGIKSVLVNRFNVGGLGRKYKEELELSHEELRSAFEYINNFSQTHPVRFYSGVCTPICILDPAMYPHISFSFCNKKVSERPITIDALGNVRFCNHSPTLLGNILEQHLTDILGNEEVNRYFNTTPDYCRACSSAELCGGGCRAASEQVYKTFSKVDPVIEKSA